MKNIHVLPTDKPSNIVISTIDGKLKLNNNTNDSVEYHGENQHIYITSDEEIEEGDWLLIIDDFETYVHKHKGDNLPTTYHKKIILTTDQDLIKDGVQSIDDEFLEWFVKNPSCEEVDIEHAPDGVFYYKDKDHIPYGCYKILIPKEEPKHLGKITEKGIIDIIGNCANCGVEFHIHKDIPKSTQQIIDEDFDGGLSMGQIIPKEEKMYTEQEVLVLLHKRDKHNWDRSLWQTPKEWLYEQFKNK